MITRDTFFAAWARSATQHTIGFPANSIKAFPGRRVDAKRAGMIATAFLEGMFWEFAPVRFTGSQINLASLNCQRNLSAQPNEERKRNCLQIQYALSYIPSTCGPSIHRIITLTSATLTSFRSENSSW